MGRGRLGYRAELDGIRGVAILLVVGYHIAGWPRGGGYGVDVFFVLSGFLITTLLLEEYAAAGVIALRAFYTRRARRLFPALFVMLVLAALISSATFTPREMLIVFGSAVFYASNFVRAFTFPDQLSGGPTDHLWSLAAEEQFYLVWPIVLLALLRRRVPLARVLAGIVVALIAYRLALIAGGVRPARIYFSPDTHSEGLALGALIAVLREKGVRMPGRMGPPALIAVGLLATLQLPHAWVYGLPVVEVASAIAIMAAIEQGVFGRLLRLRPLVYIGALSYSLYVWHMFALYVTLWNHRIIAAMLTVPLTLGSYYLVERPFRRRRRERREDLVHARPSIVFTDA